MLLTAIVPWFGFMMSPLSRSGIHSRYSMEYVSDPTWAHSRVASPLRLDKPYGKPAYLFLVDSVPAAAVFVDNDQSITRVRHFVYSADRMSSFSDAFPTLRWMLKAAAANAVDVDDMEATERQALLLN